MPPEGGLRRSASWLAVAGAVEYGLQFAMPVILVRCLDETTFGQYRLLWLLAGTMLAIAPAFMPQSLFYFLARAEAGQKQQVIGNVLIYLIGAGVVAGVVASGWNPWLQEAARHLSVQTHGMSALFLGIWVVASMLDVLPTADANARWQARAIIGLAFFRTLLLAAAALVTADIVWVVAAMLVVATVKIALLAFYIRTHREQGKLRWSATTLKRQLTYALPFAVGNGLFLLRIQADQWVVVSMLSPALYATFSIAATVLPIATLIRQPVNNALLPRLNSAHADGNAAEAVRLIARSNGAAALLLLPVVGILLVTASEVVEIMYTSRYRQAAPVMQVYLIGMMMSTFAVGHVLSALGKGRFAALNSACCLVLSVVLSIVGVREFGLVGAATGSVASLAFGILWSLWVVSRTLGVAMHRLLEWRILLPAFAGSVFGMAGVIALSQAVAWHPLPMLLAKGAVYLAMFIPFFLLAGGWNQINLLLGRIRKQPDISKGEAHETA